MDETGISHCVSRLYINARAISLVRCAICPGGTVLYLRRDQHTGWVISGELLSLFSLATARVRARISETRTLYKKVEFPTLLLSSMELRWLKISSSRGRWSYRWRAGSSCFMVGGFVSWKKLFRNDAYVENWRCFNSGFSIFILSDENLLYYLP